MENYAKLYYEIGKFIKIDLDENIYGSTIHIDDDNHRISISIDKQDPVIGNQYQPLPPKLK